MTLLLLIVLLVTLLPVFLWRRTRPLGFYVFALYAGYGFLVRDWLYGDLTFCHDTYSGYQFYFNIVRQWVQSGTEFGWNPYLGAGQPMSIMSNLFLWLPAILLAKAEVVLSVSLSPLKFANLVYLTIMFFSATGMVLLLQLLFRNTWVTFFGSSVFVWGGMFVFNLHQVWPMLIAYPLTYALFFLLYSYKSGTWAGLLLFSVFTGSMANHYIPIYVYLVLLLIWVGLGFYHRRMKVWWRKLQPVRNWPMTAACFLIFGISASPFFYSYMEMQDYVSPSRGFTEHGTISSENQGEDRPVSAPLPSYMNLINKQWVEWERVYWHTPAYLGAVPAVLILSFLPVVLARDRILRVMAWVTGILVLLGLGYTAPLWPFLVDHIPFFNMLRHPAIFVSAVPVFCILFAAGCLAHLLKIKNPGWLEVGQLACGVGLFILLGNLNLSSTKMDEDILTTRLLAGALLLIAVIVFAFFSLKKVPEWSAPGRSSRFSTLALGMFLLINLVELGLYTAESIRISPDYQKKYFSPKSSTFATALKIKDRLLRPVTGMCRASDYELEPMAYPEKWFSRCLSCSQEFSPFQITPMIQKRAIWSHMDINFVFMLQNDFAKEFRSILMKLNHDGIVLQGDFFNLAPDGSGWSFDRNGYDWLNSMNKKSLNYVGVPGSEHLGTIELLPSNDPNRVRIKVNATQDAYVLRMENYHSGWKATVDGKPVPVQKAEPMFQTIPVPQGDHLVEFRFESLYDLLVRISLCTTLLGWLGVFFWLYGSKIKARVSVGS